MWAHRGTTVDGHNGNAGHLLGVGFESGCYCRIQVRDSFSLVELPEDGLEKLLTKLKDTRVAGKQLKLRRYRED